MLVQILVYFLVNHSVLKSPVTNTGRTVNLFVGQPDELEKLKKHENILYLDTDNWATKSQVICDGGGDNCNQQFKNDLQVQK